MTIAVLYPAGGATAGPEGAAGVAAAGAWQLVPVQAGLEGA